MITAFTTWLHSQRGDDSERAANLGLQLAIATALVEGVHRRDPSVIVNGIVSLLFAAIPKSLENRYGARFRPWQRLWVSGAALVHTLGMLGPYDRIWWWDHLAHTLSGVVVAGATDISFRAEAEKDTQGNSLSKSRPAVIVGITLGFGVLWEILEYTIHAIADRKGFEPLLVHYGRLDAIGDIIFDLLGAGLVVLFGRDGLSNVTESITDESGE
ncbi:hypothetical protein Htur_4523 (plasmid) [Haloterrigena turkmenica DSM 5511]|uniref:Membrane-spanning protein n=1 Tax=Haloterrigena turkmenica (strain ATCC 51198 / DSM 5511 / JCM 9101 / NCIMB 13204 / VKM B-1734 / 4k) TaxID=543526 RepID=D2S1T1_HALTV|nr:hypothetical protein [Haloterrigena turkmenica]ADB63328.1 hypothetical protein Htur_4523 [Haloterrigena turkmenica DSM 5511]